MDLSVDTPESLAWQAERNAVAAQHLTSLASRDAFARSITAHLSDTRVAPVQRRGDRWFHKVVVDPRAEQPVAVVRTSPTGEPRVLLDPNDLSAKRGTPITLMSMWPSPDGTVLACTLMEAGREVYELVLVDVDTAERLPDEVPWSVSYLAWLPDSSGFVCSGQAVVDGAVECPVYRHVLGAQPEDPLPAPKGVDFPRPVVSPDGQHVVLATGNTEQRCAWQVVDGEVRPFLQQVDGGLSGVFCGDDLVVVADGAAPRGRLLRIPVATADDQATWVELVPESDDVLRCVDVVGEVIVLGYLRDAACRVRLLDRDGRLLEELALPADGTVSAHPYGASHPALPMFVTGDDEISFLYSSFGSSWAVYRYVVSDRRLELLTPPAVTLEDLVVSTAVAVADDGTALPTHVVHRADLDTTVPQPTLIYGYGGFNVSYLPSFNAEHSAWIEAGGVFVLAHLRGGSEFGAQWWEQGRREVKQQTFDDLYAIAEHLLDSGVTTREQLAVKGESNGGLLTGAAIVQRPDLWAAVVCDVPILDLLGFHRDLLTFLIGKVEYGDPTDPVEAQWLRAISPVHHVEPASYPAVLVTAGANDPRCPVWHARSFVGLLEQAQTGTAPILLRVYEDQGHNVSSLSGASGKSADWLAFAAEATGLCLP